ncbi:hypothetical protein PLEOSDRAFT_1032941 [Pleurotus ostreatus PC15]|uniref:5'-Nucleotidase C-terminal domain-containing protein n=1 Tax=Pleurotus ostreatus (strain PC15) TaxID=1137138 RepID=A0A067PCW5_PLEO1|nr:hypothetical protein PLEOSDRAFT_1032941 [Pleurotus ostreatus PC15]
MKLQIVHWNDVYRVGPQKLSTKPDDTIDVTQFAAMLDGIRRDWPKDAGLSLFSGDLFAPSVESSITRGSHMVPVINELAPDVSLVGNHDFDFGYHHLRLLIADTKFPWLLSNIIDEKTSKVPDVLHEFKVVERSGIRIGIIGLVEKEWIGTVSTWPANFKYKDMAEAGRDLSARLRDPSGEHRCEVIIALTHARVPNDINLAKDLHASSPATQESSPIADTHGVDLILGGHDHLYYVSRGVSAWEGYDTTQDALGAEEDHGDVLVVKSGTDFRDLSEITLELEDTPEGSVRKKVIKNITGKRRSTQPGSEASPAMSKIVENILSSVGSTMKAPVCKTEVELDLRSQLIRTAECASSNWFADIIRHAYDDALCLQGCGGADGVFICAGTLRGDSTYGPAGIITLGDIMEILPFEDPLVVLELDGQAIWDALEASLSTWPAQEGRFPVVSGFRVSWDSRKPPGQRVLGVWLVNEVDESDHGHASKPGSIHELADGAPVERKKDGRQYKVVTREYMAQGHDGFLPLLGHKYLIDDECGQMMSTIVRRYLLGSQFVNKMAQSNDNSVFAQFATSTKSAIAHEQSRREAHSIRKQRGIETPAILLKWRKAASLALHWARSKNHYRAQMNVAMTEHMSGIDPFDGETVRKGECLKQEADEGNSAEDSLLTIRPEVDGRLKDIRRGQ